MLYTSTENKRIKDLRKLNTKKYRDDSDMFLVEGEHLIIEASKNNLLEEIILLDGESINLDCKVSYANNQVMKSLSTLDNPSNMIGICKKVKEKKIGNRLLVLDDIQDPGNLGTIIRSAVAFNIDTIILSNNTVDMYNSKVIRASQGMIFNINIIRCDLFDFLTKIKNSGYKLYSTKVNGGKSLKDVEVPEKFAIIMGNEGNGVSSKLNDLVDDSYIYIDMNDKCESLNVGIAASIILYEFNK